MADRIKVWKKTLTVATATTWTDGDVYTDVIDGEIIKVVFDFTSSDANAVITLATRDTPAETIGEITGWASDVTLYPIVEAKTYANGTAAAANKTNVFTRYVVKGSLAITCSASTAADTVTVKIYWR
jgi:hypothetical protein